MKKVLAALMKTLVTLMFVVIIVPSFIILLLNYDKNNIKYS